MADLSSQFCSTQANIRMAFSCLFANQPGLAAKDTEPGSPEESLPYKAWSPAPSLGLASHWICDFDSLIEPP